jgi:hypothetical protein
MRNFFVLGRQQYVPATGSTANRTIARDNALAEDPSGMVLTDLFSTEYVILDKYVVGYDTGNTGNDYRLRIEGYQAVRGNRARPLTVAGIVPTDHGTLTGRDNPNQHVAEAISTTPVDNQLDPAVETNVGLALNRLSEYSGVQEYANGKVFRVGNIVKYGSYLFECATDHTATTWLADYLKFRQLNIPVLNNTSELIPVRSPELGLVYLNLNSGKNKLYRYGDGTLPADHINVSGGGQWVTPVEDNFDRFAHPNSFTVGNLVYMKNDQTWALARADSENTIGSLGIVSYVFGNEFHVKYAGFVQLSGLTQGANYWLSDTVAGAYTSTKPTTIGNLECPVFQAYSSTLAYIRIERPNVIGGANASTTIGLANNATNTVQDLSGMQDGVINAYVYIDGTTDVSGSYEIRFSRNPNGTYDYSTSGSLNPISGVVMIVTSAGVWQITTPNTAGFVNAYVRYRINSADLGATFPLSISTKQVVGRTDGSAPAAGFIGEVVEALSTSTVALSNTVDVITDIISINLTSGVYLIEYSGKLRTTFSGSGVQLAQAIRLRDASNVTLDENWTGAVPADSATYFLVGGTRILNVGASGVTVKLGAYSGTISGTASITQNQIVGTGNSPTKLRAIRIA